MHDPLSYDESKKCLFHLIPQVYEASVKLKKEHIIHMDLCLPNICFDEKYNVIIIDLDMENLDK